jgi:predicted nucleic acid-binding protein
MIIDASVAFKWLVEESDSALAIAWIERVELTAPTLIHAEVANALRKRVARGEIVGGSDMTQQLERLAQLIDTIEDTPFVARALEIAIELDHPVYDCVYLALAEAKEAELLTADRKLVGKVRGTLYAPRVVSFDA